MPRLLLSLASTAWILGLGAGASFAGEPFVGVPSVSLQTAIDTVADGGTIEIQAGTYTAPTGGFKILDKAKSFTVRPVPGANVVLDGNGQNPVVHILNGSFVSGRSITFENLTFRNGYSDTDAIGGGVTVRRAEATFKNCSFEDSVSNAPQTGGGGLAVFDGSLVHIVGANFQNNIAKNEGGALKIGGGSKAFIHDSEFIENRTNDPGHRSSASGGAVHIGDSEVHISNSRFERNESGFAGGGLLILGSWQQPESIPSAVVTITNSSFVENVAENHPGVSTPSPTEGGGIHAEDQSEIRLYNSRLYENRAELGGGASGYRSSLVIHDSVFKGNQATAQGAGTGFGGAIKMSSDDTWRDGATDHKAGSVEIAHSYFQGAYNTVTTVAQIGGCVHVRGDQNRAWGLNSVPKSGNYADHRATLSMDDVAMVDCDVLKDPGGSPGTGVGGAVSVTLTEMSITDTIIVNSDAPEQGGGVRLVTGTAGSLDDVTLAGNTAGRFGGAAYIQGSSFDVDSSRLFLNEVSPGESEPSPATSYGAGILSGPLTIYGADLDAEGSISNSVLTNQIGLPIYETDNQCGPINATTYDGNTFYNTTFGSTIFRNNTEGPSRDVAALNSNPVSHSCAPVSVDKSVQNNTAASQEPRTGDLKGVPRSVLSRGAAGDPSGVTDSYLVYAWSGASSTLNGSSLNGNAGAGMEVVGSGVHSLDLNGGSEYLDPVSLGADPTASFTASSSSIESGQSVTLEWDVTAGGFLAATVDQSIANSASQTGSQVVTPVETTTYTFYANTRNGGIDLTATVYVDESSTLLSDDFETGGVSAWN